MLCHHVGKGREPKLLCHARATLNEVVQHLYHTRKLLSAQPNHHAARTTINAVTLRLCGATRWSCRNASRRTSGFRTCCGDTMPEHPTPCATRNRSDGARYVPPTHYYTATGWHLVHATRHPSLSCECSPCPRATTRECQHQHRETPRRPHLHSAGRSSRSNSGTVKSCSL